MDRLTPAASFRPSRPVTRSRNRPRHMSPSPRPSVHRPFTEPTSTMFITTDYDYDCISPSSPDSELIFNMSPINSHAFTSSPPGREAVNVMALRNKTQRKSSPPLSPMLYSFPRPSRLHPYVKQNSGNYKDVSVKPTFSPLQNMGTPALDDRGRLPPSSNGVEVEPTSEGRPLAASLVDTSSFLPSKAVVITNLSNSPNCHSYPSSPIPIPRHTPRRSDPGPFVTHPNFSLMFSSPLSPNVHDTPLPSSGIASHSDFPGLQEKGPGPASTHASPAGSSASSAPLRRVEGFDSPETDPQEPDQDNTTDFRSPAASSTAYSYSGSGPFRFSRFLDDSKDQVPGSAAGVSEKTGGMKPGHSSRN